MNKEYKIKLDLNKKLYNKKMAFNQFDENVNDFYIEVTKNNKVVKDLDKSIITLVAIKPNSEVDAQFIEVKEGQIYANLKPSMCDLVGNYQAKAMIVLEGEIVTTDTINYSVSEDKIISRLNDDVVSDERFTLFTDALARLSTIEISEEQRVINEAERILSEENRKIEEAKRVEAELVRQHEEADRTKYDAIRESNENIRKQNESIRLANEANRIDEEAKRVEEEDKRKLAEEERNANYNFMTEDEERRRSEANAHKEAEVLRVQAETNRVNEEAKRRTTEQARVSAENTRVGNENTRETNEVVRKNNENQRVEAETQRQNRYNSFIADAEANASNFENYTNNAKVKEEERKANELDRKSQETQRVSNEVERISNENTRKANEEAREKNETSRQNVFENKVDEVDKKIIELNTTKDNFVSSINTKVDNKIYELDNAKSDMTNTVSNKVNEVETRFNRLTSSQQQSSEVIDARDGETSLKARLDRDIEKAKQIYVGVEGSNISTDSSVGYAKDVEILGNTVQDASNLADIRSVGDKVEGQELYEIPVLSCGENIFNNKWELGDISSTGEDINSNTKKRTDFIKIGGSNVITPCMPKYAKSEGARYIFMRFYDKSKKYLGGKGMGDLYIRNSFTPPVGSEYVRFTMDTTITECEFEVFLDNRSFVAQGNVIKPTPYQEDKLTILSPVQLEKVGDVADRIICKDGVWGVEKNTKLININDLSVFSYVALNGWKERGFRLNFKYTDDIIYNTSKVSCMFNGILSVANSQLHISTTFPNVNSGGLTSDGYIRIHLDIPLEYGEVNQANAIRYLKDLNLTMLVGTTQSQFIPLPHSQQIKLRTFANKTNISFGCEIEGTIKAQVPKSLGATVNTHTEQIRSLNNELNRVKKLEESTVSTVTTESDFTTVEATSNGYFEDVKLEGKTLVNLCEKTSHTIIGQDDNNWSKHIMLTKPLVTGNKYTLIANVKTYTLDKGYSIFGRAGSIHSSDAQYGLLQISKGGIYKRVFTAQKDIVSLAIADENNSTSGESLIEDFILLEGDHTDKPISYFEGLKSVGQSATTSEDGVDEIVVESVYNKRNLIDLKTVNQDWSFGKFETNISSNNLSFHSCEAFDVSFLRNKQIYGGLFRDGVLYTSIINHACIFDENKQQIGGRFEITNNGYVVPSNAKYMRLMCYSGGSNTLEYINRDKYCISLVPFKDKEQHTPHQSDKKRLLYYNNETQAWEKPILREWDSIEKHADGKYYYHQRSGEVVLDGSESWSIHDTSKANCMVLKSEFSGAINFNCVLDKFKNISDSFLDEECFKIQNNWVYISITKSKLSTQDAEGFKQWLQANNVTVVYQLAEEKVYECTNIDLITYANETNYVVECGAIVPRTTLKVHNNISNVVSLLQKKVSLLESDITSYMITQNRLMLASRYNADTVSFKVDVATLRNSFEYDNDLYELILNNILVGKDNYSREYIENLIIFYWMDFIISDEMYSTLFEIIEEQHNPKIIEEETPLI